jgi:abnormal spindle-like microcephaly-associated protein
MACRRLGSNKADKKTQSFGNTSEDDSLFQVDNFTVSFSDGRALCYIVHHYHPGMLPSCNINHKTMLAHDQREDQEESGDESFDGGATWAGTFSPSE